MKFIINNLKDAYLQMDALEIPRNEVTLKVFKGITILSARWNKTTIKIEIR